MPTPEQMANGAKICAVLDDALDELLGAAREALAEHGPVTARAEITMALVLASGTGRAESVLGVAATAIMRIVELERIDAATGRGPS